MKKKKELAIHISLLAIFLFVVIQQSCRILSITVTPEVQNGDDFVFYAYLVLLVFAVIVIGYLLPLFLIFEINYTFNLYCKPIIMKKNGFSKPLYKTVFLEKPTNIKLQIFRC